MSKKVILYGSTQCPDCVKTKEALDKEGIHYGFVDILAGLGHLKKFLNLRDQNPQVFGEAAAGGKIGIPTLVVDDRDIYVKDLEGLDLSRLK